MPLYVFFLFSLLPFVPANLHLQSLTTIDLQEPEAAAAIVSANTSVVRTNDLVRTETATPSSASQQTLRPSVLKRAWSTEGPVDKFGRRLMITSTGSRNGSAANSTPGTPRKGDSDVCPCFENV